MIFLKKWTIKSLTKKIKLLQQQRVHSQPNNQMIAKEIDMYFSLADIYKKLAKNKKFPFAGIMVQECLRGAAELDNDKAQYQLALKLINEAKFRQKLENEEIFSNSSNQKKAHQLFEEGIAYLSSAEQLGNIQAKRFHGLCYINGWGVEMDRKKGFDLVVESIDKEGNWEKVPQIFAEIGLNKPEFFSALVKHRGKS